MTTPTYTEEQVKQMKMYFESQTRHAPDMQILNGLPLPWYVTVPLLLDDPKQPQPDYLKITREMS